VHCCTQLVQRQWNRSIGDNRRSEQQSLEQASHEQDTFLERYGIARDRQPTNDQINIEQKSRDRSPVSITIYIHENVLK